ncbi:MAG: ATP-dependent helicase [Nitrospirota bacterium]
MSAKTVQVTLPWLELPDAPAEPIRAETLLAGLNPEQREVVQHGEGPVLVLAVAGSGKTRAITHRAAYLVAVRGVPASRILCLTFTNKAAAHMRERIAQLLGGQLGGMTVATFHSLCVRLLRMYHAFVPRSNRFTIYDADDTSEVVRRVAKDLEAEGYEASLRSDLDRLKHLGVPPDGDLTGALECGEGQREYVELLHRAYARYERMLARCDALDFTDLLFATVRVLEQHPQVLGRVRSRYQHLLVDEYQDSCPLQERLLRLLAAPGYNLCTVGDDDQAIYAFRHADASGLLTFAQRYPGSRILRMEENYRSTGAIIEAARRAIVPNTQRQPKTIRTANADGEPVRVVGFPWEDVEAGWIVEQIQQARAQGVPFGEIAVLCRVASLFRPIERELARALIPYHLVDGLAFWDRREIKDLLAYLRWIHNPHDLVSFLRIANVPPRGIGKKVLAQIEERLQSDPARLLPEVLQAVSQSSRPLRALRFQVDALREEARSVPALIAAVLTRLGYEAHLLKAFPDGARRLTHIEQLQTIAARDGQTSEDSLGEFLAQAGLGQGADGSPVEGVRLMTIHAAKGLEFHTVFLIGLEEGILPHARCRETIEEERRLLYVAITRAKSRLVLSWCRRRLLQGRDISHQPSSFLDDIRPGSRLGSVVWAKPGPRRDGLLAGRARHADR